MFHASDQVMKQQGRIDRCLASPASQSDILLADTDVLLFCSQCAMSVYGAVILWRMASQVCPRIVRVGKART